MYFFIRIQTVKNIKTRDLKVEDSRAIIEELIEIKDQTPAVDLNKLARIFLKPTTKKNYNVACTFLHRIPRLEAKDVQELYRFILEQM